MICFEGLKNFKLFLEEDFTFVTHQSVYKTSRYSAAFISPKISKEFRNDSTLSEYKLQCDDNGRFEIISHILDGEKVNPEPSDFPFLIDIVVELENNDLYKHWIVNAKLSINNVITYIQKMGTPDLYEFAAKNVLKLNPGNLQDLNFNKLEQIFSNPQLCHDNEEKLASLIFGLASYDSKNTPLLSYLKVENLSKNLMYQFMEFMQPCYMDEQMIACLYPRIVGSGRLYQQEPPKQQETEEIDSIFERYYKMHHKSPVLNGFVDIDATDIYSFMPESTNASFLLMPTFPPRRFFATTKAPGPKNIQIKFRDFAVIKGYSITSHNQNWVGDGNYMRSWCFSYYAKGRWIGIDTQFESDFLLGKQLVYKKELDKEIKAQMFKLEMINPNSSGNWMLAISRIELLGYVTADSSPLH